MASYASVKAFASRMRRELPRLDGILLNAGISTNQYHVAEQFESTLTVNFVSTFLLAFLVLPQLERTSASTQTQAHLSFVGSNVHAFAPAAQLQEPARGSILSTLSDKSKADMAGRYFLSKLMVMLCVREMVAKLEAKAEGKSAPKVIINCSSPGWCKTELFRQDDGGVMGRNMLKLIGRSAECGARCLTSAIAAGDETHGQYVSECKVKRVSVFVRSHEGASVQRQLWDELVKTTQSISPEAAESI